MGFARLRARTRFRTRADQARMIFEWELQVIMEPQRLIGIDQVPPSPWGTHFCLFYRTPEDLLDLLIPYFRIGLENNEFCMWVTSDPLSAEEARAALDAAVPDLDTRMRREQIEILDYTQWYVVDGKFDSDRVLAGWVEKEQRARHKGYEGLRLTGNTFWLEQANWNAFIDYEAAVDRVISQYHMIALCTYSLDKCGASEVIDVTNHHQFALTKRAGKWEMIESADRRRADEAQRYAAELEERVAERTRKLQALNISLQQENAERKQAEAATREALQRIEALNANLELQAAELQAANIQLEETAEELRVANMNLEDALTQEHAARAEAEERRRALEQSEREIENLNRDLEMRAAQLEMVNKELEAFSYSVSHDLRTPLNAIDSFADLLLHEYGATLDAGAREYLGLIAGNAKQMTQLVEGLLRLSRLGRQAVEKQAVAPAELVRRVIQELDPQTQGRSIEITIGDLPRCLADPVLLRQVYANLLSNAIKFTRPRPTAEIQVGWSDECGGHRCVYWVRDNGVGFDSRRADKLFGVFQRLHSEDEYEGTGIGLALVQRIIHRHGGSVWAESQVGEGATFYFTLG